MTDPSPQVVSAAPTERREDKIEVRASYNFDSYPAMDKVAHEAAGRQSDFSGAGLGLRDLGWI